jgi:hypothetical protein
MKGWSCYPIWGLELAENGHGLDHPIFGDATLVSRSFIQRHVVADTSIGNLMSGGGFRQALESRAIEYAGPAPVDRLIDIPPGAFIAVRREDPDDAFRYAESIRALLTATFALTSGQTKGFALTPLPLHWAAIPFQLQLDKKGDRLETKYRIVASNFIHLTPVQVSHRLLSEAWTNGAPIQGNWRMHSAEPLSKIMVGPWKALTGLGKRVRVAASMLARAMESTDRHISTLFAAAALEGLLRDGNSDFQELEEMAASSFQSPNGPAELAQLFASRHKVAHEATFSCTDPEHTQQIAAAWGVILLAAMVAEKVPTVENFLQHLRGRVRARRVGADLRLKGRNDLADEVEKISTLLKP